ncbi:glutathione S-transferase family protein [Yoonia sp. SS1-5]|uniref:Glutathione S-transferase family protein n=1 Tax=Yoonia rhodophyticola TaxID=3137370 RepID=A0AAN0M9X2_9RHOB
MITLITYQTGFGESSFSPFCVKAMWLLKAAGVPWEREDSNDPRKFPKAKLPAIRTEGQIIGDSHNIQAYLERGGADFWGPVAARDRAAGHALIRMAEEHMYFHVVLDRWGNDDFWPLIREAYFAAIPALLRKPITGRIRKNLLQGLSAQGLGRFTTEERMARLEPDLAAIAAFLDGRDYLLGDVPTLPDYSVAAMLSAGLAAPIQTPLRRRLQSDPALTSYVKRIRDRMDGA